MNTSSHPCTGTSYQQDRQVLDHFSLCGESLCGFPPKNNCENISDFHTQRLTPMDEVSSGCFNQQILNSNILKNCGECGERICDRFLLYALDRYWHNTCLKCHCCGALLAEVGSSCFTRRGLVLCKKDYSRMFGCSGICSGCGETILPSEMVAKAIPETNTFHIQEPQKQTLNCVFHLKCFSCAKCGSNLQPGDRYTMLGATIVCEQDWQKYMKNSPTANGSPPTKRGKVGRPRRTKE